MAKERFTFDDTIEYDKKDLKSDTKVATKQKATPKESFSFKDDSKKGTNKTMKKNNNSKKKIKIKKWYIAVGIIAVIIIGFLVYVFASTSGSGPVYGNRCAKLLKISDEQLKKIEDKYKADPNVVSISLKKECRTIKFNLKYKNGVDIVSGENYSVAILHDLDDSIGYEKKEGAVWSKLFGKDSGRGQYNVDLQISNESDTDGFPVFGTKQPTKDDISFTTSNPKNQATTDKVNQKAAQSGN